MKTLLLFPIVFCAAAIQEYSGLVKRARTKSAVKSPPAATNLTPNEAFEFTMSCTGPGEELCGKAEAAFKSASTRIATEINFKKPVLVKVIFGEPATQNSPAGAQIFISKPFPAKIAGKGDQIYNFPPALVKQANLSEGKFESKLDVIIKIDPKLSWQFEPDDVNEETVYYDDRLYLSVSGDSDVAVARSTSGGSGSTISEKPSELSNSGGIRSNAVFMPVPMDLELFAARELTRGLGFRTELVHYTTMKIAAFVGPAVISKSSFLNLQSQLSTYRPSVFDSLIYGELSNQRHSFLQLVNIISSFARSSKFTRDQYLQGILKNRNVKFAGNIMYNLLYRGKLEAKFGNEGALPIQGTVLGFGFVDYRLDDTPEFLMTLGGSKMYKLTEKMRELDMSTIYGPKTLSVLEELGYSTRRKKQQLDLIPQPD